ncbi:MAG: hypothetical protein J7L03_02575 [Caldisericaceae bacterium]|nr:hypothetical protein [Caldisericaceae bacterium]
MENLLEEYFPFSLQKLVEKRGIKISSYGREIPLSHKENLFELLKSYYFRRVLHDVLSLGELDKGKIGILEEKWGKNVDKYLRSMKRIGIIEKRENIYNSRFPPSFVGNLFEWFVGEFLSQELHLETMVNVRLKEFKNGGDIDILSRVGVSLIMMECKESPPNNVPFPELKSVTERVLNLKPELFIFVIDTTLSVERNITNNFSHILGTEFVKVKEGVYKGGKSFFVVTAKRNLLQNISFAITKGTNGMQ